MQDIQMPDICAITVDLFVHLLPALLPGRAEQILILSV
jgi:hypothetical protein